MPMPPLQGSYSRKLLVPQDYIEMHTMNLVGCASYQVIVNKITGEGFDLPTSEVFGATRTDMCVCVCVGVASRPYRFRIAF